MGQPADGRADQYALAATAFHLLTGQSPFAHANPAVVISRHLATPPPRLADSRPDLRDLDPVLARGLAKDPDDRYDTCLDFAAALAGAAPAVQPPTGAPPTPTGTAPTPNPTASEPTAPQRPAANSAPPVIISSWGSDKQRRDQPAAPKTASRQTKPPPAPQRSRTTGKTGSPPAAPTPDTARRSEANFWIDVGIDPIRIVLDSQTLFTLRCYVGHDGSHDLAGLSTFRSVVDAAQANTLALPVAPQNTYSLSGLSRDIESGVDAVDAAQLGLAGELALDVGDYTGDESMVNAFRPEQPIAQLISSITGGAGEVNDDVRLTAAVQWRAVEQQIRTHLRPAAS
jgi:serine/threonine-protein kinase